MIQLQNVTKRIKDRIRLKVVLFMVYMGKMVQERLCC